MLLMKNFPKLSRVRVAMIKIHAHSLFKKLSWLLLSTFHLQLVLIEIIFLGIIGVLFCIVIF